MATRYLDRFFNPRSIAVIGASSRRRSVGGQVMRNLTHGGFEGRVYAVNPNHRRVQNHRSYRSVADIDKPIELAVIATRADRVPDIIEQCGNAGIYAAIVLSAGFSDNDPQGPALRGRLLDSARRHGVRMLGPNCLGLIRTRTGVDATFARTPALPGNLAFVSQSGALCTAILDWSVGRGVGFSAMVSVGDALDVDFGDLLDYLAMDPDTRSILLYLEGVHEARAFVSGLRAAARMKPVIVVKAGRRTAGSRAAASHTGAMVGSDEVFDAALQRAGAVRANTIEELFAAAQVLARGYRVRGSRLAMVTNAGGPGVLAADRAAELGLTLAELSEATRARLAEALPAQSSRTNPIDVLGDADPARYTEAVGACLADQSIDGVLVLLTPQAMTEPLAVARAVCDLAVHSRKPVLPCWLGDQQVRKSWALFAERGLPHFATPEAAVEAFAHLAAYRRNQQALLQAPGPQAYRSAADTVGARSIIEDALAEGREWLSGVESKAVLAAFGVATTRTVEVHSAAEAAVAAESLGFPLAAKVHSPDITHKSDVGGVRLHIEDAHGARAAFREMIEDARQRAPDARIEGITLERMHSGSHRRELLVGVTRDPVFGPVIAFGAGGTAVEIIGDRAVALPPLNRFLAGRLIDETRASRQLEAWRAMPAADRGAVEFVLLRVSEIVCALPHVIELDINPLIADPQDAVAADVRIRVTRPKPTPDPYAHMAIHPYPTELATRVQIPDGTDLVIRPIRPEDAQIEQRFVRELSPRSKYFRFMQALQELTPEMLVRFTQIDYDREMALIAVRLDRDEEREEIGVARYVTLPDGTSGEFAIVIADAWRRRGIGSRLMGELMNAARAKGLERFVGEVMTDNTEMIGLLRHLGFDIETSPDDPSLKRVRKDV